MAAIFKEFDCLTLAWLAPRLNERSPVPYTFRYNRLRNRFVPRSSIDSKNLHHLIACQAKDKSAN